MTPMAFNTSRIIIVIHVDIFAGLLLSEIDEIESNGEFLLTNAIDEIESNGEVLLTNAVASLFDKRSHGRIRGPPPLFTAFNRPIAPRFSAKLTPKRKFDRDYGSQ